MFKAPLFLPNSKPVPAEKAYTFLFVFAFTRKGSRPALELMITAPEVKSPYSTEGIPRMTSTDSMLSVEMLRISKPPAGDAPPPIGDTYPSPRAVAFMDCKLALLDKGAPS